jgi:DNA polymerase-1
MALVTARKLKSGTHYTLAQALEILLKAGPDRCKEIWKGWKDGRQIAKSANFGFLYTLQPPGFVKYAKINYEVDVTLKQAESLHRTYFSLYRNLTEWHDRYRRLAHLNGQVRTLSGRIRRLPSIRSSDRSIASEAERQSINSPVQGFIADLKEMALIELDEKLDPTHAVIVAEVHDAILFYVKKNDAQPKTLQQIRWIMETPKLLKGFGIKLPISMDVDLTLGRWGAGKIIARDALVYI